MAKCTRCGAKAGLMLSLCDACIEAGQERQIQEAVKRRQADAKSGPMFADRRKNTIFKTDTGVGIIITFILLGIFLTYFPKSGLAAGLGVIPAMIIIFIIGNLLMTALKKAQEDHRDIIRKDEAPIESAESILQTCEETGQPYILYLRNFDVERHLSQIGPLEFGLGAKQAKLSTRRVENNILNCLNGAIPVLALPDPLDKVPMPGVYRFDNVSRDWVLFIERLIKGASFVIVYYSKITPGLMREFELLDQIGATNKTLVIIGEKLAVRYSKQGAQIYNSLSRFSGVLFECWERGEEPFYPKRLQYAVTFYVDNGRGKNPYTEREAPPLKLGIRDRIADLPIKYAVLGLILGALLGYLAANMLYWKK